MHPHAVTKLVHINGLRPLSLSHQGTSIALSFTFMTQALKSNSIPLMQPHLKTQLHNQNLFCSLSMLQVCSLLQQIIQVWWKCNAAHSSHMYTAYIWQRVGKIFRHIGTQTLLVHMITWCKLCSLHSIKTTPPHIILQPMHQVAGYKWNTFCYLQCIMP